MEIALGKDRYREVISWNTAQAVHVQLVEADNLLMDYLGSCIQRKPVWRAALFSEGEEYAKGSNVVGEEIWNWACRRNGRPEIFVFTKNRLPLSLSLPACVHVVKVTDRAFQKKGWVVAQGLKRGRFSFWGQTLVPFTAQQREVPPALVLPAGVATPLPFSTLSSRLPLTTAEKEYIRRIYVECGGVNATCARVFGAKNTRRLEMIYEAINS